MEEKQASLRQLFASPSIVFVLPRPLVALTITAVPFPNTVSEAMQTI